MKQQIQQRAKSKTYWLGIAIMLLSYVQENFVLVEQYVGEYKGTVIFIIGGLILFFREITKGPLSEKNAPTNKA